MPVSPIGNLHFINQNAPVVSSTHANNQARIDLQNAMTTEIASEKKDEIAELRPTEEIYKIDPQNEHEKQKNSQQNGSNDNDKSAFENKDDSEEKDGAIHHLDIKI